MRYRITTVSLIAMVIATGFQISLVSKASVNPSEKMRDLTVNQSAGIGTTYYVDRNYPQAQDGSDPGSKDGRETFQVFLPFVSKVNLAVFPGAEGFGTDTPGGRGGRVIRVTTLADSGAGSLREALDTEGPRVIVFEVGGTIQLARPLVVKHPYVTVAGQTAPAPGITLAGDYLRITTHDVLVQHLRIRVGDRGGSSDPQSRGGIQIISDPYFGSPEVYNVVADHCSISWAIDENITLWFPNIHDITIRHCIVSEGLDNSLHPKGAHSCGMLVGDYSKRVAVIGNLFAHNSQRNPAPFGGTSSLIVNNVVYNARRHTIHFQDSNGNGPLTASVVGNVIIPGLDTEEWCYPVEILYDTAPGTRIYLEDNEAPGRTDDPWSVANVGVSFDVKALEPPIWTSPLTVRRSGKVLEWVLANVGARPWDRDAVDERIVSDVLNGTGRIIDSQDDVGGWPSTVPTWRTLDLPDNPNGDDDGDGYTNLEEWIFGFEQLPHPTNTPAPTATSTPLPTDTPTFAPTNTPTLTPTSTPTPTATHTPLPTYTPRPTSTSIPSPTSTPTSLPTNTPTFAPTNTPAPTNTSLPTDTPTLTDTSTPTPTPTQTLLPTYTPTATNTPLPTYTPTPT